MIKRVAITGPESTGKSMIAAQLAEHYHTIWVPEYARTYIGALDRPYSLDDILVIAKEQVTVEQTLIDKANGLLFIDTELIVTKIWSEHVFGVCSSWIREGIEKQHYDLYLLMGIDLPWEPDPQREHPHQRDYLYNLYFNELKTRNLPFVEIHGLGQERVASAIEAVENLLGGG